MQTENMSDTEVSFQPETPTVDIYGNSKLVIVARSAVRFLLSQAESSNNVITKTRLQNVIKEVSRKENCPRYTFKQVYEVINFILMDIFGYTLHALPPKPNFQKNNKSNGSTEDKTGYKADHFILLNKLPHAPTFNEFKLLQNIRIYDETIIDEEYMGNDMSLPSNNTLENKLSVNQDTVMHGLIGVTLTIILFSKNNILHQELMNRLNTFGVPTDGTRIPILNWTIDEFLKMLEKREYIVKLEEKSDLEEESILYRIGRRTQAEFTLENLTAMVREITGLDSQQAPSLMDDIKLTIGDAYDFRIQ
ncbi:Smc5-Smc6 complex subunit NSE3 PWA37_004836 [Arxiozyma heterogenica]